MENKLSGSGNQQPAGAGEGDPPMAVGEPDASPQESPARLAVPKRKLTNDNNISGAGIPSGENQTPPSEAITTAQSTPLNNTVSSEGIKVRRLDGDYGAWPTPRSPIRTPPSAFEQFGSGQAPSSHVHVEAVGTAVFHDESTPAQRVYPEVPGGGSAQMAPNSGFVHQQNPGSNIGPRKQVTMQPENKGPQAGTSGFVEHHELPALAAVYREVEAPVQEREYLGGAKLISTLAGRFVAYLNPWSTPEVIRGEQGQSSGNFERIVLEKANQGTAGPGQHEYHEIVAPAEPEGNQVFGEAPSHNKGAAHVDGADRVKDVYGTPSRVDQVHATPNRVDQVHGTPNRVDQVYSPNQKNRVEAVYNPPIDPAVEGQKRSVTATAGDCRTYRVATVTGPKTQAAKDGKGRVEQVYGPQNFYIEGPGTLRFEPGQVVEVYAYSSPSHPLPWSSLLRRRMALQVFAQERRIVQIRLENMAAPPRPRRPLLIGNPLHFDVQQTPCISIEKLAEITIT